MVNRILLGVFFSWLGIGSIFLGRHGFWNRWNEVSCLVECFDACTPRFITRADYPFCAVASVNSMVLYWNHDGNDTHLGTRLKVAGVSLGAPDWLAIGINGQSGGMIGMDVAVLTRSNALEDRWSEAYAEPPEDWDFGVGPGENQKKTLEAWERTNDLTSFAFSMPLVLETETATDLCGVGQDARFRPGQSAHLVWARGKGESVVYHAPDDRGSVWVPLLRRGGFITRRAGLPDDMHRIAVTLPSPTKVPDTETAYTCVYVEAPQGAKFHVYNTAVTGDRAIMDRLVHHIILYQVAVNASSVPVPLGEAFDCSVDTAASRGLPFLSSSFSVMASPSNEAMEEVDAGFPFGDGYARYWLLEVHFNNVDREEGIVMSSPPGFDIVYSANLRKHDAGIFITGAAPTSGRINMTSGLSVPPGLASYDYLDYCPSTATARVLPENGSYIIFSRIHMHMLGVGGEVRVGNTTVARRTTWDFQNQQGETFPAPGIFFGKGDHVSTRCTYNSTSRTNVTAWGEAARDEMCLAYMVYYPAIDSVSCMDMRGVGKPALDYLRATNHSVNLAYCATMKEYSAMQADPAQADRVCMDLGLVRPIPDNELMEMHRVANPCLA